MPAGWDEAVFRWVNTGWQSPIFDPVFWFFSLGIKGWAVRIGLLGLAAVLLWMRPTRAAVLLAVVAAVLGNEIADLAKFAYAGQRPPALLESVRVIGTPLTSMGTVSAHAANMAGVAAVFWLTLGGKWGSAWAAVALLTGISRVYVGAHFPSQVLLGWLAGSLAGLIVVVVYRFWVRRFRTPRLDPGDPADGA